MASLDGNQLDGAFGAGVLRKKLYDQNLSDWSARYRKNKANLDQTAKDCEALRRDVAKQQQEVDDLTESCRQLEDRSNNEILVKLKQVKGDYEYAMQQKGVLTVQVSENRKTKQQLLREKKSLAADTERKTTELVRMTEVHDKLSSQLAQATHQLHNLQDDRRRFERELDEVQHMLRANTEMADEVGAHISEVQGGISYSMENHMDAATRLRDSQLDSTSSVGNSEAGMPRYKL